MRFEFPGRAAALALLGAVTVVLAATAQTNQRGQDPNAHAPIGAGPGTMPAKFDENVAARDRIAIMARPLPISDEQKRQIYSSVMNDTQVPVTQTTAEPATIHEAIRERVGRAIARAVFDPAKPGW
jgi:FlaG/FlaF family flagellin (archaellin)